MTHNTKLPPAVRRVLDAVRRRIRAYVWLQGIALVALVLGVAFWIGYFLDRFFEPSPTVRQVGMFLIAIVTLYVAYRYVLRRAMVCISDASAAALLERRFPTLNEHVLTAVDVASRPDRAASFHPQLVHETQQSAAQAVASVRAEELFNRGPLLRAVGAAVFLAVSIGLFALFSTDAFGFWLKRIALSEEPWPRRVHLEVAGFPADDAGRRVQKIAHDDDFELLVRASTAGYKLPDEVEIRFRLADGRRGRDTMIRVGEAQPSHTVAGVSDPGHKQEAVAGALDPGHKQEESQLFRYQFKRVASDMEFDVVGGDDRLRDLRLAVVERPELFAIELECVYPDYLDREPRRLPVTGGMRIPEGTGLVLRAGSTKPLTAVHIHRTNTQDDPDTKLAFPDNPREELRWEYGTLSDDDVLLVSVTDTDGVTSREPYRVSLATVRDEVPQVAVRLSGIGTAITPEAILPVVGKVTDDYGLERAWFEYQIDGAPAATRPVHVAGLSEAGIIPNGEPLLETLGQFDLRAADESTGQRAIVLTPGQRFSLSLKASDRFNLADEPHTGSSQQFTLDVVTVPQLLALMERRELALRQRYEVIFEKMTDTRNLLNRVEFEPVGAAGSAAGDERASNDTGEPPVSTPERALARRRLRVAGSLQNVVQSADEVAGVAEAFDDLGEQLTNNRIDNPDLKSRLREQIAQPLHRIGEQRMPQLAAQLKLVEEHIADPAAGATELARSIALADEILVEMRQVLDRMLELETYNEVVALLRNIITDQDEINRQTKERQKERLRNLFEE
ncbi:MAG: AtpZ/AtpI family protein [Planctomycetes bacterium]|nr:AtpZ/AtpI family protein [Planctomycetota bacterium]